jgi:YHS domain-containing protein
MKKSLLYLLVVVTVVGNVFSELIPDHKVLVLKNRDGVAILGYDPVSYFTDNKSAKGNANFQSKYDGAKYYFASSEHKALFDSMPAKYGPAYGGYCGYAASIDRLSPISPEWFQIVDDKLILQHNKKAYDLFNKELQANVQKADKNWPGLVIRNGSGGKSLVFTDRKGVAVSGYDPVSYFTESKSAKGDPKIEATFDGALYYFVSQEHREIFERNPVKYVPAYGGFCGYAASIGKVRPSNPQFWSIVDGKLTLQHTEGALELW